MTLLINGMCGVTAIAKSLGLHKATTHRLLLSLEKTGLVTQDPENKLYGLGPLFLKITSQHLNMHLNLLICARNEMQYLWNLSSETVSLAILMGTDVICIDELACPLNVKNILGKGSIMPIHAGSLGKVILSELPDDKLQLFLRVNKLYPIGPNTITDQETMLKEIKKIRNSGYATSFDEKDASGGGISVPIKNYICPTAIGIVGPDSRITPRIEEFSIELKSIAGRISDKLLLTKQEYRPDVASS